MKYKRKAETWKEVEEISIDWSCGCWWDDIDRVVSRLLYRNRGDSDVKTKFLFGFAIIFVITLLVYWPSFWHLFRGETYIYFLNTQGYDSVGSLISHFYNYEKVRIFEPGDTLLFRPLLFTIIGTEKALFGANYVYWHITALFLHLVATFCLFRLLWKIRAGILAVLVTVVFSTMYMIINTVLYEQVVPYMLFTALVLTALYYLDTKPAITLACMLAASFIHEVGIPFAVLMALYLWLKDKKRWGLAISAVPLVYLAVYIPQKLISPPLLMASDAGSLLQFRNIWVGLSSASILMGTWFFQVVFPSAFTLKPLPGLIYYPAQIVTTSVSVLTLLVFVNLVAFLIMARPILASLLGKVRWVAKEESALFSKLLLCMLLVFILVVSFFRAGTHGIGYVVNHNFGSYIALSLFVVLAYTLVKDIQFQGRQLKYVVASLLFLIVVSAPKTLMTNYQIMDSGRPIRVYLQNQSQYVVSDVVALQRALTIRTFAGSPSNPEYYYFSIPQILDEVKGGLWQRQSISIK